MKEPKHRTARRGRSGYQAATWSGTMIGYGKLGLLIECMKKLLLVLVLFGSLGSIAFNRLLQTHGCCTFSPTKLHFVPNFLSTHRFPEKQRFLFWHIACASYLSRGN